MPYPFDNDTDAEDLLPDALNSVFPWTTQLYGPESREAAALQGPTDTTYAWPGSALSASTTRLMAGLNVVVLRAHFDVVWTPNNPGCAIRLVSADTGPSNIVQLAEFTGRSETTPLSSGVALDVPTMQAYIDALAAEEIGAPVEKTLGYQLHGSGATASLIYSVRINWLFRLSGN